MVVHIPADKCQELSYLVVTAELFSVASNTATVNAVIISTNHIQYLLLL